MSRRGAPARIVRARVAAAPWGASWIVRGRSAAPRRPPRTETPIEAVVLSTSSITPTERTRVDEQIKKLPEPDRAGRRGREHAVLALPRVERRAHPSVEPDAGPRLLAGREGTSPVGEKSGFHERRDHGRRRPAAAVRAVDQHGAPAPRGDAERGGGVERLAPRRRAVPARHELVVVRGLEAPLRQLAREVEDARPARGPAGRAVRVPATRARRDDDRVR